MSEELPSLAPLLRQSVEVRPMPPVEAAAAEPTAPSTEQIQAVDAAFTSPSEQDLSAGLVTLWLNMPFMLELAREHFPGREKESEKEERDSPAE